MHLNKEEKDRAKKLLATTIQVGSTVIANAMRIMLGSTLLVMAVTFHFEPAAILSLLESSSKHIAFAVQAILWQGVIMAFSLAIFDAGARTFLKRNGKNVQI